MNFEKPSVDIFWFRRDLRLEDNCGLYKALQSENKILPIFIFDKDILEKLPDPYDRRVDFIHQVLVKINEELQRKYQSGIRVYQGNVKDVFEEILKEFSVSKVFTNKDYEPQAIQRDAEVSKLLHERSVKFYSCKDQVIFEENEILKADDSPYTVYTPYSKIWHKKFLTEDINSFESEKLLNNLFSFQKNVPSLDSLGFKKTDLSFAEPKIPLDIIKNYDETRDFPWKNGTTQLSIHLRFGTISVRQLVNRAKENNKVWLSELIWREFFMQILFHYPKVVNHSFKEKYDRIQWRNHEEEFQKWCDGKTGYPIVDAGMRELNQTGHMHNRVRMIVASFLCKHLLIDWRWGESYFAQKLNDYDLSANNGNWQWAAGCGCDAAPYFRVFNPKIQTEKFDKDHIYIKKWIQELNSLEYPHPIVDHTMARERALQVYREALL